MTAGDVVTAALQLLQVLPAGQSPSPDEMQVGIDVFGRMVQNWNDSLQMALAGSYASAIFTFNPLTSYANASDPVMYTAGWQKTFVYNLAMDLAPIFGRPVDPLIAGTAAQSKAVILRIPAPTAI